MTVLSLNTKQKYGSLLAGNSFYDPYAYKSIATVSVGSGGSSSVEFTSIPSTYTHLQVRGFHKNSAGAGSEYVAVAQFNGDTAANYSYHYLRGNGSSASSGASLTDAYVLAGYQNSSATSQMGFGGFVLDILDYTNTNKYKTVRSIAGADVNGSGIIDFYSGTWRSTSAITSIKFYYTASNFVQYSRFALYGIRSA